MSACLLLLLHGWLRLCAACCRLLIALPLLPLLRAVCLPSVVNRWP